MDEPLIDKFKRRGERFMNIINNIDNFNIFFYCISYKKMFKISFLNDNC